jgi:predicted TIM-barrel fold metal-dependent hydrolase
VQLAGDLGLPVLFDAFPPSMPTSRENAHMHHTRFLDLLVYDVMAKYPWWTRNVWFDMSVAAAAFAGSPHHDQFASDFPVDDPVEVLSALMSYGFDHDELRSICHDNAVDLFGLG